MRTGKYCKGLCKDWKDMINFIRGIPQFYIADRCLHCNIWFPKHTLVYCPCCHQRVRITPNRRMKTMKSNDEIRHIIKLKLDSGWTLLKQNKMVKQFLELQYQSHNNKTL
jgi:hypothetical protein